jgi:hypothetical protein
MPAFRKWLNKNVSENLSGSIHWGWNHPNKKSGAWEYSDFHLKIFDCYKCISLDLDVWDEKARQNSKDKLITIMDVCYKLIGEINKAELGVDRKNHTKPGEDNDGL